MISSHADFPPERFRIQRKNTPALVALPAAHFCGIALENVGKRAGLLTLLMIQTMP